LHFIQHLPVNNPEDIKLALVGYLNTKPFEYGIKTSSRRQIYSVYYDNPANCVKLYQSNKVDIALVPAGALPTIGEYRVITDTCIGCDDEVRTVVLMSNQPITDCKHVVLDNHSRTSAQLTRILLKQYWNTDVSYSTEKIDDLENLSENNAVLMIGDKVFENEEKYKYTYDLGHYWKKMTGLPFAYAVWIAKDYVPNTAIEQLSKDLDAGISSIDKVILEQEKLEPKHDLASYYRDNIDYVFDEQKKEALELYLQKIKEIQTKK